MAKANSQKPKNILMYAGILINIGFLIYFKYTNFFITSLTSAFAHFNIGLDIHTLNIILPLGISFYTFRALSYLFDINKNKIKATADWVVFFSYVAFFPCIVSGPIDKAKTLIPQLEKERRFNYYEAVDAMRQILWGLFKKLVIADNLASVVNPSYENYTHTPGSTLLLTVFYFSFQLYADFSGYSDMAIGIARLLGFNVTKNFDYPFFAQNIADFWRKWHISLTTWLTDYVFAPLTIIFRDYGKMGLIMAILINFTLIGIWHGANWTFILFGFLHGCYYIPLILNGTINKKKKSDPNKLLPSPTEFINMVLTFMLVSFTFVIFRSDSLSDAGFIFARIFSRSLLSYPTNCKGYFVGLILIFVLAEWYQRGKQHVLQIDFIQSKFFRYAVYYSVLLAILFFGASQVSEFIYLKF